MRNGLSIFQTKYSKTMFLALQHLVYLFKHPVVGKATLLRQKSQQTHYYSILELQLNLQKHIKICCCNFNERL